MNADPQMMAQLLASGGGTAPGEAGGAAVPSAAPPAPPSGGMAPEQAMEFLQSMGITPENAPMVAEALMAVSGGDGGAGGPPPVAGMPPQV